MLLLTCTCAGTTNLHRSGNAHQLPLETGCDQASAVSRLESFEADFISSVYACYRTFVIMPAAKAPDTSQVKPSVSQAFRSFSRNTLEEAVSTALHSNEHNQHVLIHRSK